LSGLYHALRQPQASEPRQYKAGYPCPTGEHKGGRCCIACDHDTEGVECKCIEIMDEMNAKPQPESVSSAGPREGKEKCPRCGLEWNWHATEPEGQSASKEGGK
jgi:hypothetical protein